MEDNSRHEQNTLVEQETVPMPSTYSMTSGFLDKLLKRLPQFMQKPCVALLARARDATPEAYYGQKPQASGVRKVDLGWFSCMILISALGILSVAYSIVNSRYGGAELRFFLYPGLLLIFAPTVWRLISPIPSRAERISLLCVVGFCCYLVKVMSSPLYFSFFDEFLHWRTVDDIARVGHLFSENSLLPVSPYYSGLEIVTNAFSMLSGLNSFISGLVVIGVARLLIVLTLFSLNEKILNSVRMASLATILYMANPHFILFDSQFSYESLALPIATFIMLAVAFSQFISSRMLHLKYTFSLVMFSKTEHKKLGKDLRWVTLITWFALVALTFVHHVTDLYLDGLLILWVMVYAFQRIIPIHRSNLAKTTLLGIVLSVIWISFRGNPVANYLLSFFASAFTEFGHILVGSSSSRQLFVTYSGPSTLLWERLLAALSVVLIVSCLPFGLLCLWQRYRSDTLACTLGIMSLFYPLSQAFRFTNVGADLADRAAAFLFIPITTVLAIFIVHAWPVRRLNWKHSSLIVSGISVIFLGGFIIASGPGLSLLPGPYVLGDPRSIEPEGIQGATWAYLHLGSNNRIGTDRTNQVLMGTFGDQHVVTSIADHIDISPVFFSSSLNSNESGILKDAHVQYLVVDLRLTRSLPLLGFYFVEGEPDAFHHPAPIALKALTKFNTISGINRVFDSGDIVIYDTKGLINVPKTP